MPRRSVVGIAAIAAMLLAGGARAQQASIEGRWLSESRNGVIEIFNCGAKLCGRLVWLKEPIRDGAPAMDRNNPKPELRHRPLCGLVMLGGFEPLEPQRWGDGWIYSPENGKTYSATMSLESANVLKLRGYVGIPLFGETQTWTRADPKIGSC